MWSNEKGLTVVNAVSRISPIKRIEPYARATSFAARMSWQSGQSGRRGQNRTPAFETTHTKTTHLSYESRRLTMTRGTESITAAQDRVDMVQVEQTTNRYLGRAGQFSEIMSMPRAHVVRNYASPAPTTRPEPPPPAPPPPGPELHPTDLTVASSYAKAPPAATVAAYNTAKATTYPGPATHVNLMA